MGIDPLSVVDTDSFRVHGIDSLRIVDASVMPSITNANIYAPVMMIAERAADAIVGQDPLAPEYVTGESVRAAIANLKDASRSAERIAKTSSS